MQLDEVTKDRLLLLCDYMESLPEEAGKHFRMKNFLSHSSNGHAHTVPSLPSKDDLLTCGTSACALGWGTTMPELQKLGLHFSLEAWGWTVKGYEHVFPGLDGDISEERGNRWGILFEAWNKDETPRAWAVRARKLIHEWREPDAETVEFR